MSTDFYDNSLLFPLAQAANTLNVLRSQSRDGRLGMSAEQVRRVLYCRVVNHLNNQPWQGQGCYRPYETPSLTTTDCAQCVKQKPM